MIYSVYSIYDINGDNIDDIALKIKDYDIEQFRIYIFYGGETISTAPDRILQGIISSSCRIRSAGDINNDGIGDLIVDNYGYGFVNIFYGGALMSTIPDFYYSIGGSEVGDAGYAGDVNGDGIDDFMFYANIDILNQGQVFIYGDTTLSAVRPVLSLRPAGDLVLYQNYPNPFNTSTFIPFEINTSGNISLSIYDLLGREIAVLGTGHWALGKNTITWDAEGITSGTYFIRLQSNEQSVTRKVTLVK